MAATLNEVRILKRKSELEDITNKHQKKIKLVLKKRDTSRDLLNNADYIALSSAARLNMAQNKKIERDLQQLNQLHNKFASCNDKKELIDFFLDLQSNKIGLPTPLKLIKCPPVKNWQSIKKNVEKQESIYTSLKLFNELRK